MKVKLSICISTFNRASFIGATLESIIVQATSDCEIVVVDGGSTDNTQDVLSEYQRSFARLRYIRRDKNNGVDRDFDCAVEAASGEYCWLFSDDDLLKPGAVAAVLDALRRDLSLVVVNGEHRDFSMTKVCIPNFFGFESDRVYEARDIDRLFSDLGRCLICICCVVIKRVLWIGRERTRYFGSRFIHIAVIFQQPLPGASLAISTPLMSLRLGNEQTHGKEVFLVWHINLPSLVWSLPLAISTKQAFCSPEPWRRIDYLLALRGRGGYSSNEYHRFLRPHLRSWRDAFVSWVVSWLPRTLAHRLYLFRLLLGRRPPCFPSPNRSMFPESWNRYRDSVASVHDSTSSS